MWPYDSRPERSLIDKYFSDCHGYPESYPRVMLVTGAAIQVLRSSMLLVIGVITTLNQTLQRDMQPFQELADHLR